MEPLEQMSKFLAAGTNVAATSMVWLVTPSLADDWLRFDYANYDDYEFTGKSMVSG